MLIIICNAEMSAAISKLPKLPLQKYQHSKYCVQQHAQRLQIKWVRNSMSAFYNNSLQKQNQVYDRYNFQVTRESFFESLFKVALLVQSNNYGT